MKYSEDFIRESPTFVDVDKSLNIENVDTFNIEFDEKAKEECNLDQKYEWPIQNHALANFNEKKPIDLPCNKCEYKTSEMKRLDRHMQRYHGRKDYKCEMCTYEINRPESLRKHMEVHHPLFKCFQCGDKADSRELLNAHIEIVHGHRIEQLKEIGILKKDIEPMSFAKAKSYILEKLPVWKSLGILESSPLSEALLEFGWELQGQGYAPRCNSVGKDRLKQMFK